MLANPKPNPNVLKYSSSFVLDDALVVAFITIMVAVDTFNQNAAKDLKSKIITLEGCPCYIIFLLQIGVVNELMLRARCGKAFGQAEARLGKIARIVTVPAQAIAAKYDFL